MLECLLSRSEKTCLLDWAFDVPDVAATVDYFVVVFGVLVEDGEHGDGWGWLRVLGELELVGATVMEAYRLEF